MKKSFTKVSVLFLISIMVLVACNLPVSTPEATPLPVVSATPVITALPTKIQHQTIPVNLPSERMSKIGDYDSSTTGKTAPGGDRFSRGEYERPFNAFTMDTYFPYLDIQNALIYQDDSWIFGVIVIKGLDANKALPGKYAFELDTNVDGRGDWLIMASKPSGTDWTTNDVQVWKDANGDVGGKIPILADEHLASGDGFETKVFDSGQGNDPDTAWVRIAPDNAMTIEIAVKRSLINDDAYLARMWAGTSALNPALFDFNDHMTHAQAGAADPGLENFYPIKELSELDNSCGMAIGFEPKGNEPGLCKEFIPIDPGGAPLPPVPGLPPPPPPQPINPIPVPG
jgi:hypothetical protein